MCTNPLGQCRNRASATTILSAVEGIDPWDAAVHLALGLGLRREEILALEWSDVSDTVTIDKALTYAAGEYYVGAPKSDAGERKILRHSQEVVDELKRDATSKMDELLGGGQHG